MHTIFINQSLTETTALSFIQNRLKEFELDNKEIEFHLHNVANKIVRIIEGHFAHLHLLPSEEDVYFDELNCLCKDLVSEIEATSRLSLTNTDFIQYVFILIKVVDQIIIESKMEQIDTLQNLLIQTEKSIIKLID